ncbi:chemotaxis protein, partial [Pseudomonas syringae pv. tagetis]
MRLSLNATVLSLAVLPVLIFALVLSATTVFMLHRQAAREVSDTRERLLSEAKGTVQDY